MGCICISLQLNVAHRQTRTASLPEHLHRRHQHHANHPHLLHAGCWCCQRHLRLPLLRTGVGWGVGVLPWGVRGVQQKQYQKLWVLLCCWTFLLWLSLHYDHLTVTTSMVNKLSMTDTMMMVTPIWSTFTTSNLAVQLMHLFGRTGQLYMLQSLQQEKAI